MKHCILLILFVLISLSSYAQTTPVVELFFEDAQGRRDTLLVGTSVSACDSLLNTELGEVKIDENFADSVRFSVIASKLKQIGIYDDHFYYPNFSKHNYFYLGATGGDFAEFMRCGSLHQVLVIKCRMYDFPLKISWQEFQPKEKNGFFFTLDPIYFRDSIGQSVRIYGQRNIALPFKDSILLSKENLSPWPNSADDFVLCFSLRRLIVNTKDLNQQAIPTIQAYPNPASSHIQLNTTTDLAGSQLQFFNVLGTLLKTQNVQNNQIDISDLPKGVLIGLLYQDGLPKGVFRLVKQ